MKLSLKLIRFSLLVLLTFPCLNIYADDLAFGWVGYSRSVKDVMVYRNGAWITPDSIVRLKQDEYYVGSIAWWVQGHITQDKRYTYGLGYYGYNRNSKKPIVSASAEEYLKYLNWKHKRYKSPPISITPDELRGLLKKARKKGFYNAIKYPSDYAHQVWKTKASTFATWYPAIGGNKTPINALYPHLTNYKGAGKDINHKLWVANRKDGYYLDKFKTVYSRGAKNKLLNAHQKIAGHTIGELLKHAKHRWQQQELVELKRFGYVGEELKKRYRKQPLQSMLIQHTFIPKSNINLVTFHGRKKVVIPSTPSTGPSVLQIDFQITAFLFPNEMVQWNWLGARADAPLHAETYTNSFRPIVVIQINKKNYVLVERIKGDSAKAEVWNSMYEIKNDKPIFRVKYSK